MAGPAELILNRGEKMGKYEYEISLANLDDSHSLILKDIKQGTTVLEFGPATGFMTKYMKEALHCQVYIVEYNQEDFNQAVQYAADGVCGDLEEGEWLDKFSGVEFDYIIFADVLEHLRFPSQALKNAVSLLKAEGQVIISVPNIAHNSIIAELLENNFSYNRTGLLDDTHIHFFTYRTLHQLFDECGLAVINEEARFIPADRTEFQSSLSVLPAELRKCLEQREGGSVYQLIFTGVKKEFFISGNFAVPEALPAASLGHNGRLYIDRGRGFNEEDSVLVPLNLLGRKNDFVLLLDGSEKAVRFDPLEERGCLLGRLLMSVGGRKAEADFSNGLVLGENILFAADDPQVVYTLPADGKGKELRLTVRCLTGEMLADTGKEIIQLKQEKERDKAELQNQLAVSQKKAEELNALLFKVEEGRSELLRLLEKTAEERNILAQRYELVINSRSWRITSPLRKAVNILKRIMRRS